MPLVERDSPAFPRVRHGVGHRVVIEQLGLYRAERGFDDGAIPAIALAPHALDHPELLTKTVSGRAQVKASGGIRTAQAALAMIEAGASRIGTSNAVEIVRGD
jgi:isopentenyl diphosphate isomerase/L-lactate dehydrogenase-like FMN-dependent dehydrogenase